MGRRPSTFILFLLPVTSREEDMFDLSLEIEPNCSVTSCLKKFRWACTADARQCGLYIGEGM